MEDRKDLKAWIEYKDGVLHIKHYPAAVIDLHDMKKIIAFQKEIAGDNAYSLLVDMREGGTLKEAASSLVANNPNASFIKRVAIIVDRGPAFNGVSEFIKNAKPNALTRVFLSEQEALEWLASRT